MLHFIRCTLRVSMDSLFFWAVTCDSHATVVSTADPLHADSRLSTGEITAISLHLQISNNHSSERYLHSDFRCTAARSVATKLIGVVSSDSNFRNRVHLEAPLQYIRFEKSKYGLRQVW